ncbi:MAG: lysylphosphatidylglycerol synthase domain-containing protein [Xanthobacteraceae bacterium]
MQGAVRAISEFLRDKMTWQRAGMVIGVSITAIALFVLYELLRSIDPGEVFKAIRATKPANVLLAGLFVAAGYVTLTCYDYFALRTIGRREVPYRIAAIAGFTSYSIGHNVGFTVFSGGTVRYRIYSTTAGLSAVEVAKICFIAGLTFWLGNITVLGLGFIIHPEAASAVDQLPSYLNRIIGFGLLAWLAAYVIWVSLKPRRFGRGNWSVTLPSGNLTLIQVLIGVVDLTCCAAAMYVLMPENPPIDFISLSVIFITATLLGFASHTPGGIGVFDATMLIALSQFNKEGLVGALLLFRLLYYIIPLAISLAIVAYRELVLDIKPLIASERSARARRKNRNGPPKSAETSPRRRQRRRSPSAAT